MKAREIRDPRGVEIDCEGIIDSRPTEMREGQERFSDNDSFFQGDHARERRGSCPVSVKRDERERGSRVNT